MSFPYDRWVDIDWYLYDSFDDAKWRLEQADTSYTALLGNISEPVAQIEGNTIVSAIGSLISCLENFGGFTASSWNYSYLYRAIYLAWLECDPVPPPAVTMDEILSAMVTATDDEYQKFIGLVDAYRIGLWNKPFNAEYYAALGRGFAL